MNWSFPLSCRPLRPFTDQAFEAQEAETSLESRPAHGVIRRAGAIVHLDLGTDAGRALLSEVSGPIGVTIGTAALPRLREVAALAARVPVGLTVDRIDDLGFLEELGDIVALDVRYGEREVAAVRHLSRLQALHLEQTPPDTLLHHLASLPQLRQLSLYFTSVSTLAPLAPLVGLCALRVHHLSSSAELQHLVGLAALEELELDVTNLAHADLAHLARLPALRRLAVTVDEFRPLAADESALAPLAAIAAGCPRLETLNLRDGGYGTSRKRDVDPHRGVAAIELPALRRLALDRWHGQRTLVEHLRAPLTRLQFDGDPRPPLGWLARLPTIENLLLCSEVDDAAVVELRRLPALRELFLMGTKIRDVGVAHLAGLPLTSLWLHDTRIGDAGVAHLAGMPLRKLAHDGTTITDAAGPALAALVTLEELDLSSTTVSDGVLAHLARLPRLRTLDLTRTQVTDAGLAHLVSLASTLEELQLDRCGQLTDAGMAHLGKLTSLRFLSLRDMNWVTNAGVDSLSGLTRLRRLNIYSEESTSEGEERLQALRPELVIDA